MTLDISTLITAAGAVAVALIGGVFTLMRFWPSNAATVHRQITESFQALVNEMQEARVSDREQIQLLRLNVVELEKCVGKLKDEIAMLSEYIGTLKALLQNEGITPPRMGPKLPREPGDDE